MSSISWRWAFTSLYIWGVFAGSALWRVFIQPIWSNVWIGMSFPGLGHCGQTGVLIWPPASWAWSCSSLGHSSRPRRFNSRIFVGGHWQIWRTISGTWSARVALPTTTLVGITMGWALRFLRQIGTQEEPGCNSPYVVVGTMEVGSWGPCAGSVSMWTCIQYPETSVLPWILMVPSRGIVTLCVVKTCPWTCSRQNSLGCSRVRGCGGSDPLCSTPIPPCAFAGQLEWPSHNCTEVGVSVSRSWLSLLVPLSWSFPSPCQ